MKRCPCGKYWLGRMTVCPFCGYTLTYAEWRAHVKKRKAGKKHTVSCYINKKTPVGVTSVKKAGGD